MWAKRLLISAALWLIASAALAQNPTCPTRPLGDQTNACASTFFTQRAVNTGLLPATVGGTAAAITLTTGQGYTSLSDGQEFIFTPTATPTLSTITIAVDSVAAKLLKGVDGYSFSIFYDVQAGKPMRIRYLQALDVFAILSPPTQFEDSLFGHGAVKLQASSATVLSISQDEGQALLMWNATTGAFRMVRLDSISTGNIFSANTTYVDGVANQNVVNNQLYSIYVNNTDPTNQNATRLEFWRTYTGVGVPAWGPVINEIGIYVKPTTAGGAVADNTRTFVGTVITGVGTIANDIAPAATMALRVYSHFGKNRWKFGYQSTVVSNATSSAVLTTQATPSIQAATEGITDSPRYDARATATCDTSGVTVSFRITLSVLAFNGTTTTATSPTYTAGVPYANAPVHLSASWESAPAMGALTAQTQIATSGGNCTFDTDMLGHLAQ